MHQENQQYAMPAPRHRVQHTIAASKGQPQASSSRVATPYHTPISTPAISETTSESLYEECRANSVVQCDEQNLLRALGLSIQEMENADVTSWESSSFSAWVTQRRAEDALDKFRATSTYALSSSSALNPHAGEFIPMAARLQGPPPSKGDSPEEVGVAVLQVHHPWMAKFRSGSVTIDPNVRAQYAREIVRMGKWDARVFQDLATKFAERAVGGGAENLNVVAQFARAIHRAFEDSHQTLCATAFREQMMRNLWIELNGFWNPTNPNSFLCSLKKTDKPVLKTALCLISFVGELYSSQVVHGDFVRQCLQLVVADMCVIEQLRAARVLLGRLDYHLYEENPQAMDSMIAAINKNATRIVAGQSALGEVFDKRTVQVQVEDINIAASRWSAAGPSQRRALTKEMFSDSGITPKRATFERIPPPPVLVPQPALVYVTGQKGAPFRR